MSWDHAKPGARFDLQASVSAASANGDIYTPHHPITCASQLTYDHNGTFSCEHTTVPAEDTRTRSALNHSIALLLIELATT